MYDYVNRFVASNDPDIVATFDPILGANWKNRLDLDLTPGRAAEKLFRDELRKAGGFRYVLSTYIDKSTADRPHFAIAYGTRSAEGLKAFRQIEYDALRGHTRRRVEAKLEKQKARTGQGSLFSLEELPEMNSIDHLVAEEKNQASAWIEGFVEAGARPFSDVCASTLERFMLRETDVKDVCVELANLKIIRAPWKDELPKRRKPQDDDLIELVRINS